MTTINSSSAAVSCEHLFLNLGGKQLLDDLSLTIHTGQVTTLLGPNGAGKSSLLKILCGETAYDKSPQSSIHYFGTAQREWPKQKLAGYLGVLPQQSTLSFAFTVKEVAALGLLPLGLAPQQAQSVLSEKMDKTGISHLSERLYPSLSGGEKQRVHLARVLTQISQSKQTILMLDEPTSALDLCHQHNTLNIAREMADAGAAVIVVLHDLNLAAQYSDRIIVLNEGKIQADGTPWQALNETMIKAVYGQQTLVSKHPQADYPVVYAA
ncbi:heme ABC transporter ATP-binding protein [Psychromonas ossibalaenae]|uniref:heme ABC transporter ATP-binding protein n=1 Tax=Psychromonas ossibalaenae TaxID=444922 RepID=UPI000374B9CD|nr:heme ABC transporter ATP-binding protein [Psychromonas ossibalaenae]